MGRNKSLKRVHPLTLGLLLAIGTVVGQAEHQPQTLCCEPQKAPPLLDQKALNLLEETNTRLAAAGTLAFKAVVTDELPNCSGPSLHGTASDVLMERPDKLRVITRGDGPYSEFYYDGRMITEFSPAANFATATTAPSTIAEALKAAYRSSGIYFPFTDIILTARYNGSTEWLESAVYVGQSRAFDGTTTDTIAYRTKEIDAQLWLGAQDKLPRMLVVVFRDDPLRLRHQLEFSNWQIDPPVSTEAFNVNKAILAAQEPVLPSGSELPTMNIPSTPVR